jgi:predicted small secreted protein
MKRLILALSLAAAASLAACGLEGAVGDDSPTGGTVLSVQDADGGERLEDLAKYDDHPLVPEVGWEIVVQLDDGPEVTVMHNGTRRYEPGERVPLFVDEEGALLL